MVKSTQQRIFASTILLTYHRNLGYAMLAEVLARNFSGGDFEEWAQKNIIEALDMRNTGT